MDEADDQGINSVRFNLTEIITLMASLNEQVVVD